MRLVFLLFSIFWLVLVFAGKYAIPIVNQQYIFKILFNVIASAPFYLYIKKFGSVDKHKIAFLILTLLIIIGALLDFIPFATYG